MNKKFKLKKKPTMDNKIPSNECVDNTGIIDEPKSIFDVLDEVEQKLHYVQKESQDNYDKYVRALADHQNYKRNAEKVLANSRVTSQISIIKKLLPIIDDFSRAYNAGDLSTGGMLIYEKFVKYLDEIGVVKIDPVLNVDKFDDNIHYAVGVCSNPNLLDNVVIATQETGYMMQDNIIRYAKVIVNKI